MPPVRCYAQKLGKEKSMNTIKINAKIYYVKEGDTKTMGYANVNIGKLIYLNSYNVIVSLDSPNSIEVRPPCYNTHGKNCPRIEFPNGSDNPLSKAIYKACSSAYKKYVDTGVLGQDGETFEIDACHFTDPIAETGVAGDVIPTVEEVPDSIDEINAGIDVADIPY